ncbi:DUF2550 domain-containing protein [Corynebacterium heidelbergense]|uniref:DUF2550 domain-containing protein n=1 Tax=Corynebacterium heidelbergense TaxID=2055947 RepID=A0A364VCL3_9CORY|nr:DUF2550 domain-containing protein [Corynebacterium heidelbergense]RAV34306.1 DUF2550 domain-containing protein [Corynebacterium heidelbergense]WCZ36894.1 hypothetical protein CHEID_06800 [Corynebacterium heidelbergense]
MGTAFIVLLALFTALFAAVAWRFFTLRSGSYPVLVRRLPANDGRHWRHGVLVYSETVARLYKLRSLRPESDVVLTRYGTTIVGRRELTDRERQFMEPNVHIVHVRLRSQEYEIAVDRQGDTALVSWLESAPSERRVRS